MFFKDKSRVRVGRVDEPVCVIGRLDPSASRTSDMDDVRQDC